MADYQVVDREQLDADMTDVADHIRAKAEISTPLAWPDGYKAAVDAIQTGVELPELTNPGDASKLLAGYQLINGDGEVVDGKMPIVDAATPGVSVQNNGDVVAYVDQAAGYTTGGYKTYKQSQDVIPAQTITPGTEDQVIPAYHYLTGKQTIKGDPNLLPKNIPEDLTLFGVQGERKLSNVEPPDSLALDPDVVYATTRPMDWLTMPTPGGNEIYLLCHMPDGLDGAFGVYIEYTGNCTISFGALVDGEYMAKTTVTPVTKKWNYYTIPNADYGDITSEGYRQYIVRINGGFTRCDLYNNAGVYTYGFPGIVDAAVGAQGHIVFGNAADTANAPLLRYVRFVGSGSTNGNFAFRYCVSLVAVSAEVEPLVSSLNYWFDGCDSLRAISPVLLKSGVSYTKAFNGGCPLVLPNVVFFPSGVSSMFAGGGHGTINGHYINTKNCSALDNFLHTSRTSAAINIDISSATSVPKAFNSYCLQRLTFAGETTPGGWTIGISNRYLSHQALVEMINSLPTATASATITITGNPGTAELTDEEIAVATEKNWTITI